MKKNNSFIFSITGSANLKNTFTMENKKDKQILTSINVLNIKIFLILLVFTTVLTGCSKKHEQTKKENEKFYNVTGKWKVLSYEYTSKNQGTEQTKKYTNCGTFEFNENNEGKMILEADELLITKYRYGIEDVGDEKYLVLYYNAFPLYSNINIQYNKLYWKSDEFTIVYDHSTFTAKFVCKKVLN